MIPLLFLVLYLPFLASKQPAFVLNVQGAINRDTGGIELGVSWRCSYVYRFPSVLYHCYLTLLLPWKKGIFKEEVYDSKIVLRPSLAVYV